MSAPTLPLKLNDTGTRVQELQKILISLGYPLHPAEIKAQLFGKITKAACLHLLTRLGRDTTSLETKDFLDNSSQQAFNLDRDLLKQFSTDKKLLFGRISGYEDVIAQQEIIIYTTTNASPSTPVLRQEISLLELRASPNFNLMRIRTDKEGFYVIFLDSDIQAVTLVVGISQWKNIPLKESLVELNLLMGVGLGSKGKEVKKIQQMLNSLGYVLPQEEQEAEYLGYATQSALVQNHLKLNSISSGDLSLNNYQNLKKEAEAKQNSGQEVDFFSLVGGKVVQVKGQEKLLYVQAFDVNAAGSQAVLSVPNKISDKISLNQDGSYYIYYSFLPKEFKRRPTLQVVVYEIVAGKPDQVIASSPLVYQAEEIETLNFDLNAQPASIQTEVQNLDSLLEGQLDLTKEISVDQIAHLSAETNIASDKIFFYIRAYKIKVSLGATSLPYAVFYALFSQGLPLEASDLLSLDEKEWETALKSAQLQNIISFQSVEPLIEQLKNLRIEWQANNDQILKNLFFDVEQRKNYLKGSLGLDENSRLRLTLSFLVGHYENSFKALSKKISSKEVLATYTHAEWENLIASSPEFVLPPDTPGATDVEKRKNYSIFLETAVKAKFPQTVLKNRLESIKNSPEATEVASFLSQSSFNFQKHHVDTFLDQQNLNLQGIKKETLRVSLKKLQRLSKLSVDPDDILALQAAGFDSAYSITQMGESSFVQKMSAFTSSKAQQLYATAHHLAVAAQFAVLNYGKLFKEPNIAMIPSWEGLFGALELCQCEECCSLYSPSAYFVDILEFLKKIPSETQQLEKEGSVLDLLFKKRPDLGEIELSCKNTLTTLPYIDLVNEILENQIDYSGYKNTTKSKEELALEPEHLNKEAYDKLKEPFYPGELPFDLALEETRLYLQRLGLSRKELIEHFGDAYSSTWVSETLGLTSVEKEEIEKSQSPDKNPLTVEKLWGMEASTDAVSTGKKLSQVAFFLQKTGLTFEQLQVLIRLFSLSIQSKDSASCDLQQMHLIEGMEHLKRETLRKIAHTLRVWKKLAMRFGKEAPLLAEEFIQNLAKGSLFLDYFQIDYKTLTSLVESQLMSLRIEESNDAEQREFTLKNLSAENVGYLMLLCRSFNPKIPSFTAWDLLIAGGGVYNLEKIAFFCHFSQLPKKPSLDDLINIKKIAKDRSGSFDFVAVFKIWEKLQLLGISIDEFDGVAEVPLDVVEAQLRVNKSLDLTGLEKVAEWKELEKLNTTPFKLGLELEIEEILKKIEKANPEDKALLKHIKRIRSENKAPLALFQNFSQCREAYQNEQDLKIVLESIDKVLKDQKKEIEAKISELKDPKEVSEFSKIQASLSLEAFSDRIKQIKQTPFVLREEDLDDFNKILIKIKIKLEIFKREISESDLKDEELQKTKKEILELEEIELHLSDKPLQKFIDSPFVLQKKDPTLFESAILLFLSALKEKWEPLFKKLKERFEIFFKGTLAKWGEETFGFPAEFTLRVMKELNIFALLEEEDPSKIIAKWIKLYDIANSIKKYSLVDKRFLETLRKNEKENQASLAFFQNLFQVRSSQETDLKAILTSIKAILEKDETRANLADFEERLETLIQSPADLQKEDIDSFHKKAAFIVLDSSKKNLGFLLEKLAHEFQLKPAGEERQKTLKTILESMQPVLEDVLEKTRANLTDFEKCLKVCIETPFALKEEDFDKLDKQAAFIPIGSSKESLESLLEQLKTTFRDFPEIKLVTWAAAVFDISVEFIQLVMKKIDIFPLLIAEDPSFLDLIDNWSKIYKIISLIKKYSLTVGTVDWIFKEKTFFTSTFEEQLELLALLKAQQRLGEGFEKVLYAAGADKILELSKLLETDISNLEQIDLKVNPGQTILRQRENVRLLQKGGIKQTEALNWIEKEVIFEQTEVLKECLKKQYLFSTTQSVRDELRQKQRDALVAYLLTYKPEAMVDKPWKDALDLYDYFLIDVEMNAFQKTSRIKQAISSVQLFVQKGLMGLEERIDASYSEWGEWKAWMSNYRVWEANRKVFLYPENWIEPELRDNKSPFFEEFEKELEQNDINADSADAAFVHYLEKVDQVAHLDVCGIFHQLEEDGHGSVVVDTHHVFGRMFSRPHLYYYCRRDNLLNEWSPWEKIEIDIGDCQILPVVWKSRLYLFWTMVTPEKSERSVQSVNHEISLMWSEYSNKKWTPKQMSKQGRSIDMRSGVKFVLRAFIEENTLTIAPILDQDPSYNVINLHGSFQFVGRVRNASLTKDNAKKAQTFFGAYMDEADMRLDRKDGVVLMPDIQGEYINSLTVEIGKIPDAIPPLKVLMTYEGDKPLDNEPLFLKSSQKTFFVQWQDEKVGELEWENPDDPFKLPDLPAQQLELPDFRNPDPRPWIKLRLKEFLFPQMATSSIQQANPQDGEKNLENFLNKGA